MAENDGTEAAGTARTVEVEARRFLEPDSALVRTALEMLATHTVNDAEGESSGCAHCGQGYPCPTVQHARQVVNAGGVASAEPVGAAS